MWYHALNRGNRREAVYHKPADNDAFVKAMADAQLRLPVDLLGYCLMPNHFHLVLRPHADGDLGRWMQWLLTAHARRYHRHYGTSGHIWQGRFRAFPVQEDDHLRSVLRYVERHALRAELVARAEDWKWSSLACWLRGDALLWTGDPPVRDQNWQARVNESLSAGELQRLRHSVARGRPFGDELIPSACPRFPSPPEHRREAVIDQRQDDQVLEPEDQRQVLAQAPEDRTADVGAKVDVRVLATAE
jgi:putative transposase